MRRYQILLHDLLENEVPGLLQSPAVACLLRPDAVHARGRGRKRLEDRLDAITCAYAAYHARRHGVTRSEVFGDPRTGCIVVPGVTAPALVLA